MPDTDFEIQTKAPAENPAPQRPLILELAQLTRDDKNATPHGGRWAPIEIQPRPPLPDQPLPPGFRTLRPAEQNAQDDFYQLGQNKGKAPNPFGSQTGETQQTSFGEPMKKGSLQPLNLMLETGVRGIASTRAGRNYIASLPHEYALTPQARTTLMPLAQTIETSSTRLQGLLTTEYTAAQAEMRAVSASHIPRLPVNFEQWRPLEAHGALQPRASDAFRNWRDLRSSTQTLAPFATERATLGSAHNITDRVIANSVAPTAATPLLEIPTHLRSNPGIATAAHDFEMARLNYNHGINSVVGRRIQWLEQERRNASGVLVGAFVANTAIDYAFFQKNNTGIHTYVVDIALPFAVMATNKLNVPAKLATLVGGHVICKAIESSRN